ncbi:MAG: hypothetical protein EON55_13060 [Alphaproteobacteria bacterium]|nr:MAG: hypothetical protein EON55_13060 [Alphaproteobacteria bacterium]
MSLDEGGCLDAASSLTLIWLNGELGVIEELAEAIFCSLSLSFRLRRQVQFGRFSAVCCGGHLSRLLDIAFGRS